MLCSRGTSAANMASTCFHEMVHAVQDKQSANLMTDGLLTLNVADQFKLNRTTEAAAGKTGREI